MGIPSVYLVSESRVDLSHTSTIFLGGRQPPVYFELIELIFTCSLRCRTQNTTPVVLYAEFINAMSEYGSKRSVVSQRPSSSHAICSVT